MPRLGVDAGGVGVRAHARHPGEHAAGVEEAPAHELGALRLGYGLALPREQALVDARHTPHHAGVGRHLVAAPEDEDVVGDNALVRNLDVGAATPDGDGALGQDREPVDRSLGAHLLDDTDAKVQQHHADEGEVSPRARKRDEAGKHEVHTVEQRERVLGDDPAHGLRLGSRLGVGAPVRQTRAHLVGGEPNYLGRNDLVRVHVAFLPSSVPVLAPLYATGDPDSRPAGYPHALYSQFAALLAQLDRAFASGAKGREFESLRAHK